MLILCDLCVTKLVQFDASVTDQLKMQVKASDFTTTVLMLADMQMLQLAS